MADDPAPFRMVLHSSLLERLIPSALGGRGALFSTETGPRYELIVAAERIQGFRR